MSQRSISSLPSALTSWGGIAASIVGRRPAVFCDYDGTLTPIVARPQDARLDPEMRRVVVGLAAVVPVAVVSGRDVADARAMLGVEGVAVVGSHGLDVVDADGEVHRWGEGYLPDLDRAERELEDLVASIEGARLERKRFAVTVHYREGGAEVGSAVEAAVVEVARAHPRLRRTRGKMIEELRPDLDWDKGRAVRWFLERGRPGLVPIYLGDDETDEDAFREIHADGIGIVVRGEGDERPTFARYSLGGTDEVRVFLERLARASR